MATPKPVASSGVSKNIYLLSIGIVAAVGFIAGTRSNELLGAIAPVFGIKVETGTLDLASVQKTYQQLKVNFDGSLDTNALIQGASKGLVAAAGDKYTLYMNAKEATEFDSDLTGQIGGGIGAEIGLRGNTPTIIRIIDGNPAERAGLKAGDTIISINDEAAAKWSAGDTANRIRGEVGTTVKVTVKRGSEIKDFTVTRAAVTNPSVYSSVKNGVGILTITRFDGETGNLARRAAEGFKDQQVKAVVLDLRDNGGGYLTAAQDVAGLWLKEKVVVSERTNGKVADELKSGNDPVLAGLPTVLLVNGSSASASEIVAGALQDNHAATLVGEKTFGKGTVQKVVDLGAGTRLKVTVARWYTPNGRNITEAGITPDKTVVLTPKNVDKGEDPQLEEALRTLRT